MKIVSDWTTGNGELILLDRRPSDLISLYNISHRQNTLQRQDTALYNHTIMTLLIVRTTTYDKTSIQHHQTPNFLTKFHYKRASCLDLTRLAILQTQNL